VDPRKLQRGLDWKRQLAIFNPEEFETKSVAIIGLGNIGSQTAIALARLGINHMELWDFDKVELHNLSSQAFDTNHLGVLKADAISEQIKAINPGLAWVAMPKKFEPKFTFSNILIIAVDSMKERKAIFKKMIDCGIEFPELIIDARMGGSQMEVYSCSSYDEWQETFCDKPSDDPCGARYICYTSMVIGAFIANQIKRFLKSEPIKKEIIFNINTYQII